MRWDRESVDLEYAKGLKYIGDIYYYGKGVSQSYTEALKWYRESAEKGNIEARLKLDKMYAEGQGVFNKLSQH